MYTYYKLPFLQRIKYYYHTAQQIMQQSNLDALYSQINNLPSLPAIVHDVMRITADPESSAADLMKAILPDPPMCTAILKIANSAFFGIPREVKSLEKAVMILGFNEVKNIILGKAVFNSFKELSVHNKKDVDALWEHNFTCGLAAKILAERSRQSPSEMFIAGLIHDIGKLAILITFPTLYTPILKQSSDESSSFLEDEKELFIMSHDEVGMYILDQWFFPHQLVTAVGFHHQPERAASKNLIPATIQIADVLAHMVISYGTQPPAKISKEMLATQADIFSIWQKNNLPCDEEEIGTWFALLQKSKEEDSGILAAFSS